MDNYERINLLKQEVMKTSPSVKITIEDLSLKDSDGKTLFEYMIENNARILRGEILEYITGDYDHLLYMINHDFYPYSYSNINLLFNPVKGTPIIALIFEKKSFELSKIPSKALENLFIKQNGNYLISDLLRINERDCGDIIKRIDNFDLLYNCFSNINRLDLFKYANNKCLLHKMEDGTTILETLTRNNTSLDYINRNSPGCAEILYQTGRYNDLIKFNSNVLVNYPDSRNNYLNLLIEKKKNGEDVDFNRLLYTTSDPKSMATLFITLAKNNMEFRKPYNIDLINIYDTGHKPALVHMIEMDKELTISKFVNDEIVDQFRIFMSKLSGVSESIVKNLSFEELLTKLPTVEKLLEQFEKDKNKLIEGDLFYDDFLSPFGDEETFLDYMFKNNIRDKSGYSPSSVMEVMIFIKYNKMIRTGINEELLYEPAGDNKLLIDVLMEKKYYDCIKGSCRNDLRILDYCEKYDYYAVLSDNILEELFVNVNGTYPVEKYLNNDKFIDAIKRFSLTKEMAIDLYNKGFLKTFTHASEQILLMKCDDKTILEHLLDEGLEPTFYGYDFTNLETIKILYKYKKADLMYNADLSILVNKPSIENCYLKYMIAAYKKGIQVNFEHKRFLSGRNIDIARAYVLMAQNGLVELMDDIDEDKLLEEKEGEDKCLLEHMMMLDRDTTVKVILSTSLKKNPRINALLKILSKDGLTDLPYEKLDCDEMCRKTMNKEYSELEPSPVEELLTELRELFAQDKKSNMDLVDALIISYRLVTRLNPIFIEELKLLINIKKKNPDFHYEKIDGGAYFNGTNVCCDNTTISTLNHETGHAIHHYTTNEAIPEGFFELIERIRTSPDWLKKVENYSKKFGEIRESAHKRAVDIVTKVFTKTLTGEDDPLIEELLGAEKERIKKEYIKKGYKEEDLDVILSATFTRHDFIAQKADIEIGEVEDFLLRHLYDAFISIGDFIDAISNGSYRSKVLQNEEGELIPAAYGHGVRYYQRQDMKFCEMVANYSAIIKSKHSKEIISLLRHIVGDELVDMVDNFYQTRMLNLHEEKIEEQEEVAGRSR